MRQLKIIHSITVREERSLDKYMREIDKFDLLTSAEEVLVVQKIKQGDEKALMLLVKANLRFVVSVAKQHQRENLLLGDLINEGNLGLIKAAKRFDETRGFKFISYAVWWIRQAILAAIAEHSRTIRLPINELDAMNKIKWAYAKLEQSLQRDPTPQELAELVETTLHRLYGSIRRTQKTLSLHSSLSYENTTDTMLDSIDNGDTPPDQAIMDEYLYRELDAILLNLSERERIIIFQIFGLKNTSALPLENIAQQMDLSLGTIRRIRNTALIKLKRVAKESDLRHYA
jgi:RNA polymerase primary sigma factor